LREAFSPCFAPPQAKLRAGRDRGPSASLLTDVIALPETLEQVEIEVTRSACSITSLSPSPVRVPRMSTARNASPSIVTVPASISLPAGRTGHDRR